MSTKNVDSKYLDVLKLQEVIGNYFVFGLYIY